MRLVVPMLLLVLAASGQQKKTGRAKPAPPPAESAISAEDREQDDADESELRDLAQRIGVRPRQPRHLPAHGNGAVVHVDQLFAEEVPHHMVERPRQGRGTEA